MRTILFMLTLIPFFGFSQSQIITAFPSLRIPPSSRALAMGDCGVASANGNQQLWYNGAKTAFMQNYHQVSIHYTPWMAAVSNDTRFMSVSYLANVAEGSSFGIAVNYLSMGNVQSRDNNGAIVSQASANEYNLSFGYALQLQENASLGVALRVLGGNPGFNYDPLTGSAITKHSFSACGDISYYQRFEMGEGRRFEWGAVLSNVGPKMSTGYNDEKIFLPTNLGIGFAYNGVMGEGCNFVFAIDANKLLVPTPPLKDASGNILAGKDPNRSVLNALFSSFTDAPGGLREELQEIRLNAGTEFSFDKSFFLRAGISLENHQKGNRRFIGLGAGYKGMIGDQSWGLDIHYLVPFGNTAVVSPFQNVFGFGLHFSIGSFD